MRHVFDTSARLFTSTSTLRVMFEMHAETRVGIEIVGTATKEKFDCLHKHL